MSDSKNLYRLQYSGVKKNEVTIWKEQENNIFPNHDHYNIKNYNSKVMNSNSKFISNKNNIVFIPFANNSIYFVHIHLAVNNFLPEIVFRILLFL